MCSWMNARPKECRKQARRNLCDTRRTKKGIISPKGAEQGGTKTSSSTDRPTDTCESIDPSCAPSTREQCVTGTVQDTGSLIQEVQDLLGPAENPAPSHWKDKKASTLEKWTFLRPFMVNQMLLSQRPKEETCHHCRAKVAVVMCRK
ncbi:hypothetical protein CRENBAI_003936 [Crenichthys baileyi]|uniref:Uncharacterized protein n=1 Tax=Crenichthys baileyi TaxID=28760 RepID=A0AAV9SF16_9TELE